MSKSTLVLFILPLLLSACVNTPTASSKITASQGSGINYDEYTCPRLNAEMESLVKRELVLIGAQERRIRSSSAQVTILGVGQGDGPEAAELATVRGDQNAVGKVMEAKKCGR
jgi:hypothetical protein